MSKKNAKVVFSRTEASFGGIAHNYIYVQINEMQSGHCSGGVHWFIFKN